MKSVQLGSSFHARLLLVLSAFSAFVFGGIWLLMRDALSAALCLVALGGVVWMAVLLRRRANYVPVATGHASAVTEDGRLFVSFARQITGASIREGVVIISPRSAAFVFTGGWTHLALELLMAPFRARIRFFDLAVDLPKDGELDDALRDAVERHGGFIIDSEWTYSSSQRWLQRPGKKGIIWIERPPPESVASRWLPIPRPAPERFRVIRKRIVVGGAAVVTALGLAGAAVWRFTGDVDYLVAGLAYAALVAVAVAVGVTVAQREQSR